MTRRSLNQDFFLPLILISLFGISFALSADQTGDCTSGTQYCEDNGLTTINTTVTTNTNTNNNTNNNANTKLLIDHIDGDKTNNKVSNLRLVTKKQNAQNRKACVNRKHSKFKGVTLAVNTFKKPWRADIKVQGKSITIGNYRTEEEAAEAYNDAAKTYFGDYARLNSV